MHAQVQWRDAVKFNALNGEVSCAVNRDVAEAARWIFQHLLVTR